MYPALIQILLQNLSCLRLESIFNLVDEFSAREKKNFIENGISPRGGCEASKWSLIAGALYKSHKEGGERRIIGMERLENSESTLKFVDIAFFVCNNVNCR